MNKEAGSINLGKGGLCRGALGAVNTHARRHSGHFLHTLSMLTLTKRDVFAIPHGSKVLGVFDTAMPMSTPPAHLGFHSLGFSSASHNC